MFFVVRRATLLIPSGPIDDLARKHLFICVTDPVGRERETLLVSVSTKRAGEPFDPTCRLFPRDHPFIRQESYVNYHQARIESADKIERGVKEGIFTPHRILDVTIFARVCKGLTESRLLAPRYLIFYRNATGSEQWSE